MLERKELEGNLQFVKATRKFVDEPKTGVIFSLRETLQRKARRILSCPRRQYDSPFSLSTSSHVFLSVIFSHFIFLFVRGKVLKKYHTIVSLLTERFSSAGIDDSWQNGFHVKCLPNPLLSRFTQPGSGYLTHLSCGKKNKKHLTCENLRQQRVQYRFQQTQAVGVARIKRRQSHEKQFPIQ